MKERQMQVLLCPKCGSTNITFAVFCRPSIWKCLDRGYERALITGNSLLAEEIWEESVLALTERELTASELLHPRLTWFVLPSSWQ